MSEELAAAQRELTAKVMGRPGVEGTAVGRRAGKACLKVYVSDAAAGKSVPKKVNGFPVVIEESGRFRRR